MVEDLRWYKLQAGRWKERGNKGDPIWRDSQRQKVYDAERYLRNHCKNEGLRSQINRNTEFSSIKEIERYIDKLLKSAWFIRRWGKRENPTIVEIQGHTATAWSAQNKIDLPRWGWNKVVVLHELAHIVHMFGSGTSHGRYFCRTLLELIEHELGLEARRFLKKRYTTTRVKSTPHPIYTVATILKKKEHGQKLAAKYGVLGASIKSKSRNSEWNGILATALGPFEKKI